MRLPQRTSPGPVPGGGRHCRCLTTLCSRRPERTSTGSGVARPAGPAGGAHWPIRACPAPGAAWWDGGMAGAARAPGAAAARESAGLAFTGEMYGVQLDHLAAVLGVPQRRAAAIVARWRRAGLAEAQRLGPGPRWAWLTKAGLARCGLPFAAGAARWRSERRIRARIGGRLGLREHVPDAEVAWPDGAPVGWAGECWAIEAEITPKTVARTAAIMRELLTRTGDYGCPPAEVLVPGRPARHDRAIYLCSPPALPVAARARARLGDLGARVEIRPLPPGAAWPAPGGAP